MVLIQRANKQLQIPEEWLEQYVSEGYKVVEPPKTSPIVNKEPRKKVVFTETKSAEE